MTDRPRTTSTGGVGLFAGLLLVAQALLALAAIGLTAVQPLRTAVCDAQCDFAMAAAALAAVKIAVIVIFIVTLAVLGLLRKRLRPIWLIPFSGIVLTIAAMIITNQIFIAALPVM